MHRIPTLLLTALLAAGCLGTEPDDAETTPAKAISRNPYAPSQPTDVAANGAKYTTHESNGTIGADAVFLGADAAESRIAFPVPANATGLVAELRWTGEVSDLDLGLSTPNYCPGRTGPLAIVKEITCYAQWFTTGEADGIHTADQGLGQFGPDTLRIQLGPTDMAAIRCDTDECRWSAFARVDAAVNVDFDLRATVFYSSEAPEGFTTLGD